MQKRKVAKPHIVKVDLDFCPVELGVIHGEAVWLIVDQRDTVDESCSVHTLSKFASEQIDSHDTEDEPEDETHEEHIHNGGNRSYEGVHHYLMSSKQEIRSVPEK